MEEETSVNRQSVAASIYHKLDSSKHEIRLLTLHPAQDENSTVRCTLSHASLHDPGLPAYETVSYVWGEHVFESLVLLDEHKYYVTSNLASILRYLRESEEPRLLWVDALCINQHDLQERSQQVTLMRTIFSRCEQALAWLGPDAGHYNAESAAKQMVHAMELMEKIGAQDVETLRMMETNYAESLGRRARRRAKGEDAQDEEENDIPNHNRMILSHEETYDLQRTFRIAKFWSRAWVVQELSCAPNVTLLCEGGSLDWGVMSRFFRNKPYADAFHDAIGSHSSRLDKTIQTAFSRPLETEHQRWILQNSSSSPDADGTTHSTLLDVLARFRDRQSSDPRDKVYSLLGLVTEDHGIVVDYTKSVEELFQEVTVSIINRSGNLDIICQNPFESGYPADRKRSDGTDEDTCLPTWVADLRVQGTDILFAHRDIFNAGKKTCDLPCRLVGPGKRVLTLKGIFIARLGPVLQDYMSFASAREIMLMYLGKHVLDESDATMYPFPPSGKQGQRAKAPEPKIRAYWRTLLKDCTLPPRMRRFRDFEIPLLDSENTSVLRTRGERDEALLSFYSSADPSGASASSRDFQYLEDDGELALDERPALRVYGKSYTEIDRMRFEKRQMDNKFMFTVAENGLFLLVRNHAMEGDVVVVLDGGKVPMILRKAQEAVAGVDEATKLYEIVGPAYAHGFMDGEAEAGVEEGWLTREEFALV